MRRPVVLQPNIVSLMIHLLGIEDEEPARLSATHRGWKDDFLQNAGSSFNPIAEQCLNRILSKSLTMTNARLPEEWVRISRGVSLERQRWIGLPRSGAVTVFAQAGKASAKHIVRTMMAHDSTRLLPKVRSRLLGRLVASSTSSLLLPHSICVGNSPLLVLCRELMDDEAAVVNFRLGTGDRNRKTTVAVGRESRIEPELFLQLADTPTAGGFMKNHEDFLIRLQSEPALVGALPKVIDAGRWRGRRLLVLSSLDVKLKQTIGLPNELLQFLVLVSQRFGRRCVLQDTKFFRWATSVARQLPKTHQASINALLRRLVSLFDNKMLPVTIAHRDFDYKNAGVSNTKPWVIDWEWAQSDWPAIGDGLNYLISNPATVPTGFGSINDVECSLSRLASLSADLLTAFEIEPDDLRLHLAMWMLDRALIGVEMHKASTPEISSQLAAVARLVRN